MKQKHAPTNLGGYGSYHNPLEDLKGIKISTVIDDGTAAPGALYDKIPDECPICRRGIDVRINKAYIKNYSAESAQIIFQCPRKDCLRFFIGYYIKNELLGLFYFSHLAPIRPVERDFDEVITLISPQFVEIYNEASHAEQVQLTQICGVGYRKALEVLIKDYAISLNTDEEIIKALKSEWLSKVIENFIDDPRIQANAKRATWLGNDETHYVRKWEDKDLKDLKTLIELTVRWIEMVEMSKEYKDQMPEGKE